MNGHFRTTMLVVLMAVVFGLPQVAQAHFGQSKGAAECTSCHNDVTPIPGATIPVAINGTVTTSVTVNEGDILEIDLYYTGVSNKDVSGIQVDLPATTWAIMSGVALTAPAGWSGTWSSFWDKASHNNKGWMNFTDAGMHNIFTLENSWTDSLDGLNYDGGNGLFCDAAACGNDLDGTVNTMGTDMRILVPKGAGGSIHTITIYGVGHTSGGTQGNIPVNISVTVNASADSTPPTDGTGVVLKSLGGAIDLSWGAASDASGIALYKVVYNSSGTAPTSCSDVTAEVAYVGSDTHVMHRYQFAGGLSPLGTGPGDDFAYRVCAYDTAGNESTGTTALQLNGADDNGFELLDVNEGATEAVDATVSAGATNQHVDTFNLAETKANGNVTVEWIEVLLNDFNNVSTVYIKDSTGTTTLGSATPTGNAVNIDINPDLVVNSGTGADYTIYVDVAGAATGTITAIVSDLTTTSPYNATGDVSSATLTIGGADVTPPVLVTNFTATSGQNAQVPLSWTNPADGDLAEVLVMRKVGSYPTDHLDAGATQVYQDLAPTASAAVAPTDTTGPPVNGTTYYYAVFTKDSTGNWNETVTAASNANTATPAGDVTPPVLVANFTATSGQNAQVPLSWTNPADGDLAEVLVMRKVGSYPTDHLDAGATQVYQDLAPTASAAVAPTDTTGPPVNGTTYYYAVFTKDSTGNWNETVTGGSNANTATPSAGNANPDSPTNLTQYLIGGVTPIGLGGYTTEASVVFEADIADSTDVGDQVQLQIDTDSNGTFDCQSALGANPSTNVQVPCAVADGSYDWQARTVDNLGATSAWVPFNAASPDFIKDASAPVDGTLTATPGDTQVVLNWTAATDAHSGLTSPAYAVAKSTVSAAAADCASSLTTTDLLTYTDNAVSNGTTYYYRICATNNAALQSIGTTDSAIPAAGCVRTDPSVSILTGAQDITTDGGFVNYTVQVTNNDSVACGNTTFNLSASNTNTTNFYVPTLIDISLDVAPGVSLQTSVRVTAIAGETVGTNDIDVTSALDVNHAAVTSTPKVTTTINILGGGCVSPGDYLNTNGDRMISSRR